MKNHAIKVMLMASTVLGAASFAHAEDVTLTIESWRNDDLAIWQETAGESIPVQKYS